MALQSAMRLFKPHYVTWSEQQRISTPVLSTNRFLSSEVESLFDRSGDDWWISEPVPILEYRGPKYLRRIVRAENRSVSPRAR